MSPKTNLSHIPIDKVRTRVVLYDPTRKVWAKNPNTREVTEDRNEAYLFNKVAAIMETNGNTIGQEFIGFEIQDVTTEYERLTGRGS